MRKLCSVGWRTKVSKGKFSKTSRPRLSVSSPPLPGPNCLHLHYLGLFLSCAINARLLPFRVCVFFLRCARASHTGAFVAEKNALKLILRSVKTKQMLFFFCNWVQKGKKKHKMLWQSTFGRFTCCCGEIAVGVDAGSVTEPFWLAFTEVDFPKNHHFLNS